MKKDAPSLVGKIKDTKQALVNEKAMPKSGIFVPRIRDPAFVKKAVEEMKPRKINVDLQPARQPTKKIKEVESDEVSSIQSAIQVKKRSKKQIKNQPQAKAALTDLLDVLGGYQNVDDMQSISESVVKKPSTKKS